MQQRDASFHSNADALEQLLSASLDDALDEEERAALAHHLEDCAACRAQLAELRRVRELLRALPQPALPRSFLLPEEAVASVPRAVAGAASPPSRLGRGEPPRPAPLQWARVVQSIGTIAAVLGLTLLLGAGIVGTLGPRAGHTSSAAQSSSRGADGTSHVSSTQLAPQGTTTANPGRTPEISRAPANQQPTAGPFEQPAPEQPPLPLVPITAAGLIVGGGALIVVGRSGERRAARRTRQR